MLVLGGRKGDKFHIGHNVELEIISTCQGLVKLGFTAPRDIEIDRAVIREAKIATRYPDHDSYGDTPDLGDHPC